MEVDDAIVVAAPAEEEIALAGRAVDNIVLEIDRKLNAIKKILLDFQIGHTT